MRKGDLGSSVANLQRQLIAAGLSLAVTSIFDGATELAVIDFQKRAGLVADGVVGTKTLGALLGGIAHPAFLSENDLINASKRLGVDLAAIKAVNQVESRGHGFLPDGRPVILYERHVMYRQLAATGADAQAIAEKYPNIVAKTRGGYSGGTAEYARLGTAAGINPVCALESCSWGQFQIMGFHWEALGYASVHDFVDQMKASEGAQLEAFVRFIEADPSLHKALKSRRWAEFARGYNGAAYKENLYDVKLARAFERFSPNANEASA